MSVLTYLAFALVLASSDVLFSHLKGIKYKPLPSIGLALIWPITCLAILMVGILEPESKED